MLNDQVKSCFSFVLFLILSSFAISQPARPEVVARKDCFPFEQLPNRLRSEATKLLKKALDSEALYTMAIDMKPMSGDFTWITSNGSSASNKKLQDIAQILKFFHCGKTIQAELMESKIRFNGERHYSHIIFNRVAFDRLMIEEQAFFSALGDVFESPGRFSPRKVLAAVENSEASIRFRGYGLLFGYPKEAVDFFVSGAEEEARTGRFVKREFVSIPTFSSKDHRFVWAVPVGHQLTAIEREMQEGATPILQEYIRRRTDRSENKNSVELIRNWFSVGKFTCDTDKPAASGSEVTDSESLLQSFHCSGILTSAGGSRTR